MLPKRIRILDERTINQIAAGEVVENPASVVKELVENALDSGATQIIVETKGAGRGKISVSDNGCGMHPDDLILSMERHATSKILEVTDLDTIHTLGFRGEALSAIASVSKFSIHTSPSSEEGMVIQAEGGKIHRSFVSKRQRGTTVEVKGLFYNVPVRKKFQKSQNWDQTEIHKTLIKMSLCHPSIGLTWINDEKKQFEFLGDEGLGERIRVLFGEEWLATMLPISSIETCAIEGYISHPTSHRSNRTGQHLFINQRPVVSSFISKTVLEAYATRLPCHRYPLFVLNLRLPSTWIDVNVHPQKKEVRLREEELVFQFLIDAIGKCLRKTEAVTSYDSCQQVQSDDWKVPAWRVSEPTFSYQPASLFSAGEELALVDSKRRVLAKLGNYLIVQDSKGIICVDTLAAKVRIAFEKLTQQEPDMSVLQGLLIPISIECVGAEKTLLSQNLDLFCKLGISIRHFGGNTFMVDAISPCLEEGGIEQFLHVFLEDGKVLHVQKLPKALSSSLRGGVTSLEEGALLVERLFACEEPSQAPDGRATYISLSESALSTLF